MVVLQAFLKIYILDYLQVNIINRFESQFYPTKTTANNKFLSPFVKRIITNTDIFIGKGYLYGIKVKSRSQKPLFLIFSP